MNTLPSRLSNILIFSAFAIAIAGCETSPPAKATPTPNTETQPTAQYVVENPMPRGTRLLGMDVTEGSIGFERAFALAKEAGLEVIEISVQWDNSESKPGKFTDTWLKIANQYYPATNTKVALSLNPIDTNNLRLPTHLKNKRFNDPEVVRDYKAWIDFTAALLPNSAVSYVSIGNEVDIYLGESKNKWQEYSDFFCQVAPYARGKFPKAVIGSEITFDGTIRWTDKAQQLNKCSDVALVSYYPFEQGGFLVSEPGTVNSDFKKIVAMYPGKKIYFSEIGYPSGAENHSSEAKQAEFIKQTFASWDAYGNQIQLLRFIWMHDLSAKTVADYAKYYGLNDKGFASYLGTLGLRTHDGKDKQGFVALRANTKKRDW